MLSVSQFAESVSVGSGGDGSSVRLHAVATIEIRRIPEQPQPDRIANL
jgi:hypothetical protein